MQNKAYTEYQLYDNTTNMNIVSLCESEINPIQQKLFSEDIITTTGIVVDSKIRSINTIPGILVLQNNRTFGRTANKKRLLYRCIPNDKTLPDFLIPYTLPLEFSKNPKNIFILFKFEQWTDKHPHASITKNIGDIDYLNAYYEYRLCCEDLVQSNAKINQLVYKIRQTTASASAQTHTDAHQHRHIFTIDSLNTTTYDDALELSYSDIKPNIAIVSVHISDVVNAIEQINLWDQLATNIHIPASIYMPDKRHSLLPPLIEHHCSLTKGSDKRVITASFYIDTTTNQIIYTDIQPNIISITCNYVYESPDLFRDTKYTTLYDLTQNLVRPSAMPPPTDSIELVEFWMLKTNALIATALKTHHSGIFRTVKCAANIQHKCRNQEWNTYHRGKYQLYDPTEDLSHDALHLAEYIHITSPIRRLVDILNQITLYDTVFKSFSVLSNESLIFLQKWSSISEIDKINDKMRSIQKIQTECELLSRFTQNPELLQKTYRGIVVDICQTNPKPRYIIYLYDIRIFCSVKPDELQKMNIDGEYDFRIFIFKDENTFHKKIRILCCL